MKKELFLVMCLLCPIGMNAQFSGNGSGTSDDPYQITTADELFDVRNSLSASYKLMNDIDLTEWIEENNPVGGWSPIAYFNGFFNGNDKVIFGLYINRPSTSNIGLFGEMSSNGYIYNLKIQNAIIIGDNNVGVIAGVSNIGNIGNNNCVINPKIRGTDNVGGLVGKGSVGMKNCVINPKIEGQKHIGGITGYINEISTIGDYLSAKNVQISNNFVVGGDIRGQQYVGGIIGYIEGRNLDHRMPGTVKNEVIGNYCSAAIFADKYVGGICGCSPSSYYFQGKQNTTTYGEYSTKLTLTDNRYDGKITCTECAGGIVGMLLKDGSSKQRGTENQYQYVIMSRNLLRGNIVGEQYINGLHGYSDHYLGSSINEIEDNVCVADTISASKDIPCRIVGQYIEYDASSTNSNYALSKTKVLSNGKLLSVEDDSFNGSGVGESTLKKKTIYEGMGFDFEEKWEMVENEEYPHNINQSHTAIVTSFISGTAAAISGTAIGKKHQCNGKVYVSVGDSFFEGVVTNGQWSVQLGEVKEGQEAKVTVMTDDMMPSILVKAIAEKGDGSGTPQNPDENIDDTDISNLDNVVYFEKVEYSVGELRTLSLKMKNSAAIRGFQFDLYLPEGVTVAKTAKGKIVGSLSAGRLPDGDEHTLTFSEQADGAIRFLCSSQYDETFTGNDGEIATLTVNIADNMADGDYPIVMKNMKLTETNINNYYETPYVKSTLTILSYTIGDINNDGVVDVSDYTGVANHIHGNTPTGFNVKAADVDENGSIDVSDYTGIANIIHTGSIYGTANVREIILTKQKKMQEIEPE